MAAGFMAGFGTQLSQLIEDDRKYYREAAAKRRDYLQTYGTRAVAETEKAANTAMGTMNYLITNGIPKEDVRYVLDTSGVQGIAQLKATLDSRDDLTKEEKTQLVKKAKDYVVKNPDEDLNTVVKRAYGLYKSESNPVKRERSLFASMLGLDAKMMEDDVLDDMYINGMSGRDIYRIMGSAGPQAGAPLDLNVPTKAPSPQNLSFAASSLKDKFEYAIDTKINQAIANGDVATREELEKIKERGVDGMADLAKKYEDLGLFEAAHRMELEQPGLITRNIGLGNFSTEYKTWLGDKQDDATMKGAEDGKKKETPPTITTPIITTPTTTTTETYKFKTKEEFNTAASKGAIPPNAQVEIGDMPAQTFTAPKDYVYTPAKDVEPEPKAKAPGLAERFSGRYNLDTSKADKARAQAQNTIEEVGPILSSVGDFIDKGLGYGVGGFNDLVSTVTSGIGVALDFVGAETLADGAFTAAYDMAEGAEGMRKYGFFDNAVKSVQRGDYVESEWIESAADFITQNMPEQPGLPTKEDIIKGKGKGEAIRKYLSDAYTHLKGKAIPDDETLSAAAQRAPDHVVKLGEQATKMWRDLSEAITGYQKVAQDARRAKNSVNPIFEKVANMSDEEKEARTQEIINYVEERKANQRAESERKTIEAFDRQFIADWKNMPASVKTIVLGSKPKKQGMTEEETIRDLDRQFIKDWEGMPVQNKVIIRDVLYGKRVEEFTEEENKRLNEMREAHPEWFIDTLLDSLDVPAPSQVDTTYPSRPDFGPGIMSRMKPSELKEVDLEGAPKIGDVAFENMLERVHGGSSKIVEDFRKKITAGLKASDVTRLIKTTQGLPKTKSRDTLLMSLYDLRDALNKR